MVDLVINVWIFLLESFLNEVKVESLFVGNFMLLGIMFIVDWLSIIVLIFVLIFEIFFMKKLLIVFDSIVLLEKFGK